MGKEVERSILTTLWRPLSRVSCISILDTNPQVHFNVGFGPDGPYNVFWNRLLTSVNTWRDHLANKSKCNCWGEEREWEGQEYAKTYTWRQQKEIAYYASRGRIKLFDFFLPGYNRLLLLTNLSCWNKQNKNKTKPLTNRKKKTQKNYFPSFFDNIFPSSFSLVKRRFSGSWFWSVIPVCTDVGVFRISLDSY